jgi:uncharacterized protein (DUF1800 family)
MNCVRACALLFLALLFPGFPSLASDPPVLTNLPSGPGQFNLNFAPYPAAQGYTFLTTTNLNQAFAPNTNAAWVAYNLRTNYVTNSATITTNWVADYQWRIPNASPPFFAQLQVTPMSSNDLLTAIVLNRLAYGPTPDELERVRAIGAQAYIDEQLAPENIVETIDAFPAVSNIALKFVEAANPIYTNNAGTNALIADLRAWHVLRGIGAKRQLLEILLQFFENHFVTQYSKSASYFDSFGLDGTTEKVAATQFEYRENQRWRNALLNPACTFYDLLKISAESPAMIIYLDTVLSKGSGSQVANENYARELLELFTMGVNNGYDQNDITVMSRCWTGWSVQKLSPATHTNPLSPTLSGSVNTNIGVWAFKYKTNDHNIAAKTIFPAKTVPARFGPPWESRSYQISIPATTQTNVNGIQEGYTVISNLANLAFTEEFISVKLCQLFVHENFEAGYDFTDPNLPPEGRLVRDCMLAWENSNPKGQLRPVLRTIFGSDLFRGDSAALHKVKTPLEYTLSAIRALRSSTNGTGNPATFSADSDGYSISGSGTSTVYPLIRMGYMLLFDRQDPNGYPEDAQGWVSAGTLAERIRWIQTYCMAASDTAKSDSIGGGNKSVSDPVALLRYKLPLQVPPGSLTNPANVADYLLRILYPGEGAANLALYRGAAIRFLETADDGVTSSPLAGLSTSGNPSPYETRLRGAVAMLMTLQRFQEQ